MKDNFIDKSNYNCWHKIKDFDNSLIKYNIEDIINEKLYEEKIIDENTYKFVKNKLLRLLYELDKNVGEL